jgi:hypothetical protein
MTALEIQEGERHSQTLQGVPISLTLMALRVKEIGSF